MSRNTRLVSYNTLNEDEVEFCGTSQASRRTKQRKVLQFVVVSFVVLATIIAFVLLGFLIGTIVEGEEDSSGGHGCVPSSDRFNCLPEGRVENASELCQQRGCCWDNSSAPGISCFYPAGFGYSVSSIQNTPLGFTAIVQRKTGQPSQYGGDINTLRVDVMYETDYRLHIKVKGKKGQIKVLIRAHHLRAPPHNAWLWPP